MYVFLSDVFYKVSLAPIFKKLDAFIPALSLLANYIFCLLLFSISQQHQTEDIIWYQPLCVSFYYIIYIVNVCIFECTIFTNFHWRQFSKSWTPSFLPYSAPGVFYFFACFLAFRTKTIKEIKNEITNPCVFLFIILYI